MNFLIIDIIIFAIIAVFLFFKLNNTLGTRHGEERDRKTIFDMPDEAITADKKDDKDHSVFEKITDKPTHIDRSLEGVMTKISLADRYFTPDDFVKGAKGAFEIIVEAFARGDKETLEPLLSHELMDTFEATIDKRAKKGDVYFTDILNIKKADITDASLEKKASSMKASVTVRFVADETKYVKNKDGELIAGDPEGVSETIDIWTFEKDLGTHDPNWILIATASERTPAEEKTGAA